MDNSFSFQQYNRQPGLFPRIAYCKLVQNYTNFKGVDIHYQGGHFKNAHELLNLKVLKFSPVNKIHIFQCMGKISCVEFQRVPLKFHTKYLTDTLKDVILHSVAILRALRFKSMQAFLRPPPCKLKIKIHNTLNQKVQFYKACILLNSCILIGTTP